MVVTIRVTVNGGAPATVSVTVADDESRLHLIPARTTIPENAGTLITAGRVLRNTPVDVPLTVRLVSSNASRITVPATVTIPAGQAAVSFPMTVVDNTVAEGSVAVTIAVTALGQNGASVNVTVVDNDR